MNPIKEALDKLRERRDELVRELESVDEGIRALEKVCKTQDPTDRTILLPSSETPAMSPARAIDELFRLNPDREMYPSEIRDALKTLKARQQLATESSELLGLTHLNIRRLIEAGEIEAQPGSVPGQKKWYRLCANARLRSTSLMRKAKDASK